MNAHVPQQGGTTAPRARPRTAPQTTQPAANQAAARPGGIMSAAQSAAMAQTSHSTPQGGIQQSKEASTSWMRSGKASREAYSVADAEMRERRAQRATQVHVPYELRLKAGETREYIILDAECGPSIWRHRLQDKETGYWNINEPCPKLWEACCLCDGAADAKPSSFVMYLTVQDLTPYIDRRTQQQVNFAKRLLIVPHEQIPFFHQLEDEHGTLRGVHVIATRTTNLEPSIGVPKFHAIYDENAILQTFAHAAVHDVDGNIIKDENEDCYAADYSAFLQRPSNSILLQKYGGVAPYGSDTAMRQAGLDDGWGGFDPKASLAGGGIARSGNMPPAQEVTRPAAQVTPQEEADLGYEGTAYSSNDLASMATPTRSSGIARAAPAPEAGDGEYQEMNDDVPF